MNNSPMMPPPRLPPTSTTAVSLPLDATSRWFFVGKTKSGKTFLAKSFLRRYERKHWPIAIIDTGHSWMWDDAKRLYHPWATSGPGTVDRPRRVARFNPRLGVQAYEPGRNDPMKDPGLMQFCRDISKHGNCLVYIDETYGLMTATFCPEPIADLWVRGRKKYVAAWAGSQRPSRVPEIIMSQAENWAILRLINPLDLEKVARWTGNPKIADKPLPARYWWFWNEDVENAVLMQPIER